MRLILEVWRYAEISVAASKLVPRQILGTCLCMSRVVKWLGHNGRWYIKRIPGKLGHQYFSLDIWTKRSTLVVMCSFVLYLQPCISQPCSGVKRSSESIPIRMESHERHSVSNHRKIGCVQTNNKNERKGLHFWPHMKEIYRSQWCGMRFHITASSWWM